MPEFTKHTNNPLFSYSGLNNKVNTTVKNSTPNQTINFGGLVDLITSKPPNELKQLRSQIKKALNSGLSWKQIKTSKDYSIDALKKKLPFFLCSGVCPIHHNDKDLEYNGCIQIDIDFKFIGGDILALEVLELSKQIGYIKLATISPSGYGVKAIVQTNNLKKEHHNEAQKQVIDALRKDLDFEGITFDALGASQPCYIPYNPNPYYNEENSIFVFDATKKEQTTTKASATGEDFTPQSSDAITAAIEYAESKGAKFEKGRHIFLNRLAIAFNLFGISHDAFLNYVFENYISAEEKQSNFDSPFKKYADKFGAWQYKLIAKEQESKTTTIRGKEGDKVSELATQDQANNAICIAPTGSGKTYWFMYWNGKRIIFCPVLSLVDNIIDAYSHLKPIAFTGTTKPSLQQLNDSDCIVTTYASFQSLRDTLNASGRGLKQYHGIVDEIHCMVANGHQEKDLTKIIDAANEFKSFTGFTGTDLPSVHPELMSMNRLIIDIPRPSATYEILEVEHTLKAAKVLAEKAINKDRKFIILHNEKNTSKKRETLKQFIDRDDVWYFDSNSKLNPNYIDFVKTGVIPNDVKGIVTTTVIETGLSIETVGKYDFIFCGNFNPVTIEQLRKRARNATDCYIYILKSINRTRSEDGFNLLQRQQYILKCSITQCESLNLLGGLTGMEANRESIARQAMQNLPIFFSVDSGRYEVNLLKVGNLAFRQQTTATNRNDKLMQTELAKYQIFPSEDQTKIIGQAPTRDEEKRAAEGKEQIKKANADQYNKQVSILEDKPSALTYCDEAINLHSANLTATEKKVFKAFIALSEYGEQDQVIGWLKSHQKPAQRKRLLNRLKYRAILDNPEHMAKNTHFVLLLKKLQDSFEDKEIVTGEVLKGRVIDCLKLDKTINLKPFIDAERNTKVIDIARHLFEVKKLQKKEDGKVKILWQIGNLSWESYYNKTKIKVTAKTQYTAYKDDTLGFYPPYKSKTKVTEKAEH